MIAEFSAFYSYFLWGEEVYFGFICYSLITCVESVTQCSNFNIIILLMNAMKLILLHEYKWNIVLSFVVVCRQQLLFFIYFLMQPIFFCLFQDKSVIERFMNCFTGGNYLRIRFNSIFGRKYASRTDNLVLLLSQGRSRAIDDI